MAKFSEGLWKFPTATVGMNTCASTYIQQRALNSESSTRSSFIEPHGWTQVLQARGSSLRMGKEG